MKEEEEGLHSQECGSRYARMDREGCARSTLYRNKLDARVFHMPSTLTFLRKSCLRITSTMTASIFFKKETFRFFGPFTEKNSSRIFHCSPGLIVHYRNHKELAGIKLQSLGLALQSQIYRQPNMAV